MSEDEGMRGQWGTETVSVGWNLAILISLKTTNEPRAGLLTVQLRGSLGFGRSGHREKEKAQERLPFLMTQRWGLRSSRNKVGGKAAICLAANSDTSSWLSSRDDFSQNNIPKQQVFSYIT